MKSPKLPNCFKVQSKPHPFCPGCGHPVVLNMLGRVIDEMGLAEKVVFLVDIGCSLLAWNFFDLATSQTHHGRTVPTAVGLKKAAPEKIVIAYVGDGGAYAIGLQHTLSAAMRNDPITTIVINNTLYAMTGGQQAPTTIEGEVTTTTPLGKKTQRQGKTLHGPEVLSWVADKNAYLARGSSNQPLELKEMLKKALQTQIRNNFSLVEAVSACPTNWRTSAPETIKRMNQLEKVFKIGEINR
jgi:2-oxoglutarate ferredoxin oxidoreductase subunit beta